MKKLLFLILLFQLNLNAQKLCGTKDKDYEKWISDIGRPELNPTFIKPRATIYIPMHYHIVRKDDGTGGYPLNYLFFIHCDMNYEYARSKVGIQFYIDTISYINSTKYYDISKPEDDEVMGLYNTLNHCNVYLVNDPNGACGYVTDFPTQGPPAKRSGLFIQASKLSYDCSNPGNKTLPHEMGHWLDLRHTFFGWEGYAYSPTTSQSPKSTWENVARSGTNSNCLVKGDGFCDTDPDYVPSRWNCPYSGTPMTDAVGVSFTPTGRNFMSYSNDACSDTFSPQQASRMVGAMSSYNDRKDMLNIPYPTFPDIDTITWFNPVQYTNANYRYSRKNLKLSFKRIAGVTKYLVTLGKSTNTTITASYDFLPSDVLIDTLITDSFVNVPVTMLGSLANNTYFYWKVRAFNKTSACGNNVISKQAFRVKDLNVEVKGVNPKCFTTDQTSDGSITVYDSSGVSSNVYYLNGTKITGNQVTNLGAGSYSIEVRMADNTSVFYNVVLTNPTKVTGLATYPSNFAATITASGGTPPYTYTWSNSKTGASQAGLAAGNYTVTIKDANGCVSDSIKVKINSNGSGGNVSINSIDLLEMNLYPTKVQFGTQILISNTDKLKDKPSIEILDLSGKLVKKIEPNIKSNSIDFSWDIQSVGYYMILLKSENISKIFKVESY